MQVAAQCVTSRNAAAGSPAWSQDGKRPVFYEAEIAEVQKIRSAVGGRGSTQIVSIDLETGTRQALTHGPGEKWSPRWIGQDRIGYVTRDANADGGVAFIPAVSGARGEMRSPAAMPAATPRRNNRRRSRRARGRVFFFFS